MKMVKPCPRCGSAIITKGRAFGTSTPKIIRAIFSRFGLTCCKCGYYAPTISAWNSRRNGESDERGNEIIKDLLRRSGEPTQLCALARIEELERALLDAETQHRVEYCEDAKYDCIAQKNCKNESKEKILSIRDEISQRFNDMLCVEKYKSSTFSDTWTAAVSFAYSTVQKVFRDNGYGEDI